MEVYPKMLHTTLLIGLLCGIVGVLVDMDHVVAYFTGRPDKFFHPHLLVASSVVLCSLVAYLGGLLCS